MYDGSLYLEVVRGQRSPYTPGMDRKDDLSPADTESSETLHRSTHTMNATYDNNHWYILFRFRFISTAVRRLMITDNEILNL